MQRAIWMGLAALALAGVAQAQTPLPAAPAPAAAASPYAALVPVAGTSDVQRSAAIAAALTQVLQRVSPGFVASPDVLAQAPGYVRDYRYQRAAAGAGLQLQVEFDPGAIGRLVAQGAPAAAGPAAAPTAGGTAPAATATTPGAGGAAPSQAAGGPGTGTLWVGGVADGQAFVTLLATLRGDAALHDVVPVAATGDGVLLRLGFDQPLATVLAALETPDGHLAQATAEHPGADASLRWVP